MFLADANIGRKVYVCINLYNDCPINRGPDQGSRLKELRKAADLSQTAIAEKINVSYSQYGRYELKGLQPPADTLNKLAEVLNTTVDYLLNGNADEKAQTALNDTELLAQFKEAEKLPDNEKIVVLKMTRGYIRDYKTQQAYK